MAFARRPDLDARTKPSKLVDPFVGPTYEVTRKEAMNLLSREFPDVNLIL